ncbi:TorF family putative porin [Thiobacillus sedimenti]|uniref:TorF family putative porin n=1 Tax=Thiobacillus sedimenti TaxID=3110231 RepID=A0ABZ1CJW1_9PROT|nr:TorF family putative porin [Thiobacillus sp. SCUT-2]WRS39562.1 TorF family putative porin [Thiobacillus sp. SCUT-2]
MKKTAHAWVLAGLVGMPTFAIADEPASPHTLTANVGLTSNYVFRGISQTQGEPAIQGGLDYSHASGFYLGTWGSNVGWLTDFQGYKSGSMELDIYGGYRNAIGPVSYDVGAIRYMYPGSKNNTDPANTTLPGAWTSEAYASVGWKWFTAKYSYYLSDSVFGVGPNANGSGYLDLSASLPVADTGLTLGAHWGSFNFKNDTTYSPAVTPDYKDWKVSATYDLGKLAKQTSGMNLGVAYSDTDAEKAFWHDASGRYLGKATTTVWISKTF